MKNILLFVLLITVCVCSGCTNIPYQGERPSDYFNSVWVCEEPYIWFNVEPHTSAYSEHLIFGEIISDNKVVKIQVSFDYNDSINIYEIVDDKFNGHLKGKCEFAPDKLIVDIYEDKDSIFYGEYETITFINTTYKTD